MPMLGVARAQRVGDGQRGLDVTGGPAAGEHDVHRGVTDRRWRAGGPRASVATGAARRAASLAGARLGARERHEHAERPRA